MQKKIFLCVLVAILACMLALGVSAAGAATNEYGEVTIVEGAEGDTTVISKDAKMVVKASDGTFYTVPSYYVLTDTAEFNWKQNKALNKFLGYSETMSAKNMKSYVIRMEIPEGITATELNNSAGADTMEGAPVVEVNLPSTLRYLGAYSFKGCKSLTKVTGLENVTYFGTQAFYNGPKIGADETFVIAEGTEFIGARCFQGALFVKVVLPSTIKTLSDHAFASCNKVTEFDLSKCANLEAIGIYCFEASAISSFDFTPFASKLTTLGEGAFNSCRSLTTLVGFDKLDGIKKISDKIFNACPLTEITMPKNIESIGASAFRSHASTQSVLTIPNGVTTIGDHAFTRNQRGGNVKVILPAYLESFTGTYQFENWNVYEMYIPSTLASIPQGFVNKNGANGVVYYFTGDENGIDINSASNSTMTNATWVSADEFTGAVAGKNFIVYGYSYCDAFFNGEHEMTDEPWKVNLTSYFDKITFAYECVWCDYTVIDESATINPIFTYLGYSCTEVAIGGGLSVTQGYSIDREALDKYCTVFNHEFKFGLVASVIPNPLDPEMSECVIDPSVKIISCTSIKQNYFAIKIVGIPNDDAAKAMPLVFCMYVEDDSNLCYLDGGVTSANVNGISYNDILNLKKGEA